jgi:hypothetical protein
MKQSVKDKVTFCKHCGTAYLIDIEGDHEVCDVCADQKDDFVEDTYEAPVDIPKEEPDDK